MGRARIGVVVVSFLTLLISSGVNLSFGLFLAPLSAEFGGGRAAVSLAATVNLVLFGVMQPVFGRMIDRHGPRRVLLVGLALMGLGNLALGFASSLWQVCLLYGVVGGIGFTASGILPVSVLILRWFGANRRTALTMISTGSSLGQALFYQLTAALIARWGWRATYATFGAVLAVLVPACIALIRDDPPACAKPIAGERVDASPAGRRTSVRELLTARAFLLLGGSYLACGFTDFMITTHLAALAIDKGFGAASGARALSVLAVANVLGLLVAGRLGDRIGTRVTLVVVYAVRALSLTMLAFVGSEGSLYAFAFLFGLTFFTTAPLTSALINELYGLALTGTIFGAANAVHHLAGAAGAYLAGRAFDAYGTYLPVFALGAATVYLAAWLTYLIGGGRTGRPSVGRSHHGEAEVIDGQR